MPSLPPATKALILACIAVFCLQLLPFLPMNGLFALWPLTSGHFFPWQVVSYAFLHADITHLSFNMLGLWMFGAELERLWGARRFWQLLAASVVTAAIAQLVVTQLMGSFNPTVGASGALYGLLLAYAMVFPRRQFDLVGFLPMLLMMIPLPGFSMVGMVLFVLMLTNRQAVPIPQMPIPAPTMVAIFGALELFFGVAFSRSGVAHFAHLGGMLGAWLLIRSWRGPGRGPRSGPRRVH